MPGGLVQIVNYGNEDITLTGNPQITFFNIVFRRYTNFGKKTTILSFDNNVDFGYNSVLTIPKSNGDLLSKIGLRIKLPSIDLTDITNSITDIVKNDLQKTFNTYYSYYDYFFQFINNLKNIVNIFFLNVNNNITFVSDLNTFIRTYINNSQYLQFFTAIKYLFNLNINFPTNNFNLTYYTNASLYKTNKKLDLIYVYSDLLNTNLKSFTILINKNMKILDDLNNILYKKIINTVNSQNPINFKWIDKIGINIVNNIELFIGSNQIVTMSDYYINNYYELNCTNKEIFNEVIGLNNKKINKFANKLDEQYIYLPIPLWFNNNYGMAFPLLSLQYNSIQLKVNFKKLIECIKIEINDSNNISRIQDQILDYISNNYTNIITSQLEVNVIAEFIYLDNIERKNLHNRVMNI